MLDHSCVITVIFKGHTGLTKILIHLITTVKDYEPQKFTCLQDIILLLLVEKKVTMEEKKKMSENCRVVRKVHFISELSMNQIEVTKLNMSTNEILFE